MKNKITIKNNLVYKKFLYLKSYETEKYFYLTYQLDFEFLPKLLDFNDELRLLIFENCGCRVKINKINFKIINDYYNQLVNAGIFHNDMRLDNILYNSKSDRYYIIDYEKWDFKFTDRSKINLPKKTGRPSREIRMYLDNYNLDN